jgi:hypothetical protein
MDQRHKDIDDTGIHLLTGYMTKLMIKVKGVFFDQLTGMIDPDPLQVISHGFPDIGEIDQT